MNLRAGGQWSDSRVAVLSAPGCGDSAEVLIHTPETGDTSQRLFLGRCNSFNGTNSALPVALNEWTHVAVTVSAGQQVSYFINGVAAGTWDGSGVNCALGGNIVLACNLGASRRSYHGLLDEVAVWSTARSQVEIQAGMNQSPNLADPNLVAYWPFNEGLGAATTADASGHGRTGTLVKFPQWAVSPVGWLPQLGLHGAHPSTNECHTAFTDPGAVGWVSAAAIAGGGLHSLALKADGVVIAWGWNDYGQCNVPATATNVVAIAGGGFHSLALKADGSIVGWGHNGYGQCIAPTSVNHLSLPITVSGNVDTHTPGSYTLTYTVTSTFWSLSTNRTVVVVDTIPPVLTLLGNNPGIVTNASRVFTDPGAIATDYGVGLAVITNSTVNLNFPGTYTIGYTATDISGNSATTNRIVFVALPPAVTGDSDGDGVVSAEELTTVQQGFWQSHPLQVADLSGVGSGMMSLGLSNSASPGFTVQASTNLVDWMELTNGLTLRYQINDPNAAQNPMRFYRLRTQ